MRRKVLWVAAGSAWQCAKLRPSWWLQCQRWHGMEQTIEPHVSATAVNEYGERVTMMYCAVELIIGNAFFQHKKVHKTTWTSPNGKTTNEIDYIWIRWRSSLMDVGAYIGILCFSCVNCFLLIFAFDSYLLKIIVLWYLSCFIRIFSLI